MPSDMKKKKAQEKRNNKKPGAKAKAVNDDAQDDEPKACNTIPGEEDNFDNDVVNDFENDADYVGSADEDEKSHRKLIKELETLNLLSEKVIANRAVTGSLHSQKVSRDIHISGFTITFHGQELLQETDLRLNNKRRYGLIGLNGCGKSTLMAVIASKCELPIPDHIDIFLLQREMEPSNKTALQCVIDVDTERTRLEAELETLSSQFDDVEMLDRFNDVQDRLEAMDASKACEKAAKLLYGLGFTKDMQNKQVKHFSGGWRMRIALARALYLKPALLLLDEPTNHLDLNACVWLENELKEYPRCLVITSHSQDFLNGVCTDIINMSQKQLRYYGGNYETFLNVKAAHDKNQEVEYQKQQREIEDLKEFVNKFGQKTRKLARQAQSREKRLDRILQDNPIEAVHQEKSFNFSFPDPGELPPPVIQVRDVSFGYNKDKLIYEKLELAIDLDTRVALVGPNGAGKSTLLKLIAKELDPTDGLIQRHSHVRMGRYHQHLHEKLDLDMSALEWMQNEFPDIQEEDGRKMLGRYGLSGKQQSCRIRTLSDGQRCRIIFAYIAKIAPHILLMDEPTNHLDIPTIDALAMAIKNFPGGLLLVSHDFRLISQVANELWVCDNRKVEKWNGDIYTYKKFLKKQVTAAMDELVER